jgi:hypothetical protein
VSTTGQDSQAPLVNPATVAEWRRRQEACSETVPPLEGNGKRANGFQPKDHVAINGSTDSVTGSFAEAQQTALTAMIGLANADVVSPPPSAAEPGAAHYESLAPGETDATHPLSVIVQPSVADQVGLVARQAPALPGRSPVTTAQTRREPSAVWGSSLAHVRWLPLTVILIVQAALSLRLVWSNTAFPDEALYLWSGRLEWAHWLHGASIPDFPTYFSGAPVVYPPLGAMAASLGGLAGARILSLCFMLTATLLLHGVTRRIFDRRSANFAAALFVGLAATQFLGAFATYDAMALTLLALATWLSVRAAETRLAVQVPLLFGAAGALALADAAKYAAALFDPVVIVVAGLAAWRAKGRGNGVLAAFCVLWVLCLLVFAGIRLGGHPYWRGINFTTLTRAHGTSSPRGIIADSFGWVFLVAILAAIGSAVAMVRQTQLSMKLCVLALAGAIVLAPANQARIHVFTSLFKHVGFGAWFAAAVGGYALASLADAVPAVKKQGALMTSTCAAVVGIVLGAMLAQTHFNSWPNTTNFIGRLQTLLPEHRGSVLAADNGNVIEFYLEDEIDGLPFYGPWFFRYQDPSTGKFLVDRPAYADAIRHRYFSVIALSFSDSRAIDEVIEQDIRTYGGYTLVATLPYQDSGSVSAFRIWVRGSSR